MDSLTNLFQAGKGDGGWLSKFITSPGLKLGLAGSGAIGNIMANRSRNQVLSKEMQQMDMLNKLTPAEITSGINSLQQPMSTNLINNVTNATQGKLAERGLSQAPGIFASELGQGLAPYQLQLQQMAQDAYFRKLGLPISARPSPFGPFPQTTNTNQLWQSLIQQYMGLDKSINRPGSLPANANQSTLDSLMFPTNWGLEGSLPLMPGTDVGGMTNWTNWSGSTPDFSSIQPGGG